MPDRDVVIRLRAQNLTKSEIDKARRQLDGLERSAGKTGKAFGPLQGDVKRLAANFAQMNPVAASLTRNLGGLSVAAAGTVGVVAGLSVGLGVGVRHVIELGDQITTLSAKTKLSTDFLQKLKFAAHELDTPFEAAATAISKLQVNLGKATPTKETTDALGQLGLSLEELRQLDPESQFLAVGAALKGMTDEFQQSAAAQALFSRAGIELLPLLRGNYEELIERAEHLGLVMDEDLLEAGDALGENWETLKTSATTLAGVLAGPLVKSLAGATSAMTDAIAEGEGFFDTLGKLSTVPSVAIAGLFGFDAPSDSEREDPIRAQLEATKERFAATLEELDAEAEKRGKKAAKEAEARAKAIEREIAAEAKRIESLAASVGKSGIIAQANELSEALEELDKRGEQLSSGGIDKVLGTLKQLKDENLEATGALGKYNERVRLATANLKPLSRALDDVPIAALSDDVKMLAGDIDFATSDGVEPFSESWLKATESMSNAERAALGLPPKIRDVAAETDVVREAVENLAHTFQVLGIDANSTLGSLVANFSTLAVQIPALKADIESGRGVGGALGRRDYAGAAAGVASGIGAIGSATESGSQRSRVAKGALAGASTGAQVAGPYGAIVGAAAGAITGFIRGRNARRALEGIRNEVGVVVSEGILKAIRDSGRPAQLMIADIFAEGIAAGTATPDDLAREIGDVFSFLERGDISQPEAIRTLEQATGLLLQNLHKLGPAGEAEIARIIDAAKMAGIEFEGLSQLISSTFAPATVEEMAASLDLTNEQVRDLANRLGVDVQTNLERMAQQLGVTVEQFRSIGKAVEQEYGLPLDQVDELLASMGVSAQELATALGVDLGDVQTGTQTAADETERAAGWATRFADEMARANREAGGIRLPGGSGTSIPDGGFQFGTPGLDFMDFGAERLVPVHREEAIIPRGGGHQLAREIAAELGARVGTGGGVGGGMNVSVTVNVQGLTVGTKEDVSRMIGESAALAFRRNFGGFKSEVSGRS